METTPILLVEDNDFDQLIVREALDASGIAYTLNVASSLDEGSRMARSADHALALLDLGLPDSSGIETLRSFRGRFRELPLVVFTGLADEQLGLKALQMGAEDYLVKGRDQPLIARAVRYAIERTRVRSELNEAARRGEQQERIAALGTLVAGVAHEINNPLTYVKGNLELSAASLADLNAGATLSPIHRAQLAKVSKYQASVLEGVDRIAGLTRSLRQLARRPSGQRGVVDVTRVLSTVHELVSAQSDSGIVYEVVLGKTPRVLGNEGELIQVVLNLVLNATEAMERGVIHLEARSQGDRVRILVVDHGPGIPAEDRDRVFTPFFTTKAQGTGLGLSVSHKIVADHRGTLTFTDTPGGGTTFVIDLPAHEEPEADVAP